MNRRGVFRITLTGPKVGGLFSSFLSNKLIPRFGPVKRTIREEADSKRQSQTKMFAGQFKLNQENSFTRGWGVDIS